MNQFNEEKKILTLDDYINRHSNFNIRNVTYFKNVDNLIIPDFNLYNKFNIIIKSLSETFITSNTQRSRYNYRPALLSQDMYGTTELIDLILFLNDCESPSDFRMKKNITLLSVDNLEYFFDNIVLPNQEFLEKNKMDMGLE